MRVLAAYSAMISRAKIKESASPALVYKRGTHTLHVSPFPFWQTILVMLHFSERARQPVLV